MHDATVTVTITTTFDFLFYHTWLVTAVSQNSAASQQVLQAGPFMSVKQQNQSSNILLEAYNHCIVMRQHHHVGHQLTQVYSHTQIADLSPAQTRKQPMRTSAAFSAISPGLPCPFFISCISA